MRKITFGVLTGLLLVGCSTDHKKPQKELYSISEIVKVLASDEFEGRKPDSDGMDKAGSYVENYFREIGVEPYFGNSYRDSVIVSDRHSYNVVGKISADKVTDKYILIGAHLDHLGIAKSGIDSVYNGANDNASGVTAVLQIAEDLKQHKLSKNILLSIFTEEESGLNGAKHLAKRLKSDDVQLVYVINLEMIGKPLSSDSTKVYITGFDKSNFAGVANNLMNEEFVKFEQIEKDMGLFRKSDNYPFFTEFNVPSHTISTFDFQNYPYYHNVKDEFKELDIKHLENVIEKCSEMIIKLLGNEAEITLNNQN